MLFNLLLFRSMPMLYVLSRFGRTSPERSAPCERGHRPLEEAKIGHAPSDEGRRGCSWIKDAMARFLGRMFHGFFFRGGLVSMPFQMNRWTKGYITSIFWEIRGSQLKGLCRVCEKKMLVMGTETYGDHKCENIVKSFRTCSSSPRSPRFFLM